jgi:hypothetical protein
VTIGVNLRNLVSGAVLAFTMAVAIVAIPGGAQAKQSSDAPAGVSVCNTASPSSQGGDMQTLSQDPQTAVHYTDGMKAKNNANVHAAMHSRALSLCDTPAGSTDGPSGGGVVFQ